MSTKKTSISKGLKYLALALPLLFGAPVLITIGFKALAKSNIYWVLIIGIVLAILAILLTAKGISAIIKSLFEKE